MHLIYYYLKVLPHKHVCPYFLENVMGELISFYVISGKSCLNIDRDLAGIQQMN